MLTWRDVDKTQLEPGFAADIDEVFGEDPGDWYITQGKRSLEYQLALYQAHLAGGPKAAPPGKSAHNYGLAIDFCRDGDPVKQRLQPEWNESHPDWIRLRAKIDAHPRLHGGWWFGDGDHVERTKWAAHIPPERPVTVRV